MRAAPASLPLRISLMSATVSCSSPIFALKFSIRLCCAGSLAGCDAHRRAALADRLIDHREVLLQRRRGARIERALFGVGDLLEPLDRLLVVRFGLAQLGLDRLRRARRPTAPPAPAARRAARRRGPPARTAGRRRSRGRAPRRRRATARSAARQRDRLQPAAARHAASRLARARRRARVLAFQPDRALEPRPRAHRRLARLERRGRAQDLAQIRRPACRHDAHAARCCSTSARSRGVERAVDVFVEGRFVRMHITSLLAAAQKRAQLHARLEHL